MTAEDRWKHPGSSTRRANDFDPAKPLPPATFVASYAALIAADVAATLRLAPQLVGREARLTQRQMRRDVQRLLDTRLGLAAALVAGVEPLFGARPAFTGCGQALKRVGGFE